MPDDMALAKPKEGAPCNGCGLCCRLELCPVAEMAYGRSQPAPCPSLGHHSGRYWCKMVETEAAHGMKPWIAQALGIGLGCSMDDRPDDR